jgi:hypothetical protein
MRQACLVADDRPGVRFPSLSGHCIVEVLLQLEQGTKVLDLVVLQVDGNTDSLEVDIRYMDKILAVVLIVGESRTRVMDVIDVMVHARLTAGMCSRAKSLF